MFNTACESYLRVETEFSNLYFSDTSWKLISCALLKRILGLHQDRPEGHQHKERVTTVTHVLFKVLNSQTLPHKTFIEIIEKITRRQISISRNLQLYKELHVVYASYPLQQQQSFTLVKWNYCIKLNSNNQSVNIRY